MAESYEIKVPAQGSIYSAETRERILNVYFSLPSTGMNSQTGIVVLLAGYGGNPNSNVYKKMRDQFADRYNLVALQCDYFGSEFMQNPQNIVLGDGRRLSPQTLAEIKREKPKELILLEKLEESLDNFNEMGLMQGLDHLTALIYVINLLCERNKLPLNRQKIILYGHSHGAYLAYVANVLAPGAFSLLIDNSAWLYPVYLKEPRAVPVELEVSNNRDEMVCAYVRFNYLAAQNIEDSEVYSLTKLYQQFENECRIIGCHGKTDQLVDWEEKRTFYDSIKRCQSWIISEADQNVFKSTGHGLGADFFKLFDHVIGQSNIAIEKAEPFRVENVSLRTAKFAYTIRYPNGMPWLERVPN